MSQASRSDCLLEISQELTRFQFDLRGLFRCPVCLRDYDISSEEITEEHIVPDAQGGRVTTFLCKTCNSTFGSIQTRWLSDWIDLNEGGAPFHTDPKKQRAKLTANGRTLNGSLQIGGDGAVEFYIDRNRSNPNDYEAYLREPKPPEIQIATSMPVFANEDPLQVGFLTAAYGLWFKSFGYSFILQSNLNLIREQILNPDRVVIDWNYLIEIPAREIRNPSIGLMRFDKEYFPIAVIYDHIVLLPTARKLHPRTTKADRISKKLLSLGVAIFPRYQHLCVGPAVLICDGQAIIQPDLISNPTISPQYIRTDGWP